MIDRNNQRPDLMTSEEKAEVLFPRTTIIKQIWHPSLRCISVSKRDCKAIKSVFVYDDMVYEAEPQDVW